MGAAHADEKPETVSAYLAMGYSIADKRQEKRWLPGKPPYADLKRLVYITTYRLERDGSIVVCEVAYDSQQDSMQTTCR